MKSIFTWSPFEQCYHVADCPAVEGPDFRGFGSGINPKTITGLKGLVKGNPGNRVRAILRREIPHPYPTFQLVEKFTDTEANLEGFTL